MTRQPPCWGKPNATKRFIRTSADYDKANVVDSYASNGNLNARYVTPGLDMNLSMTRGGNSYYYMADGLGSIRNVVDTSETVQNTYDYYAFGNTLGTQTATVTSPYEYTAREFENGSVNTTFYYRNRYYMSGLGIFMSRDAMWADMNEGWGYVRNHPAGRRDPEGTSPVFVGAVAAMIGIPVATAVYGVGVLAANAEAADKEHAYAQRLREICPGILGDKCNEGSGLYRLCMREYEGAGLINSEASKRQMDSLARMPGTTPGGPLPSL